MSVEFTQEQLEMLQRLADQTRRRDSLGDMASDDYFEELWDRPHLIAALATIAPKANETWTEEQLAVWLRTIEGMARLVYKMDATEQHERRDRPVGPENHEAVFKARYMDVLLLALEAEVESGKTPAWTLCDRIERCLEHWVMHAPWLAGEMAESLSQRARANAEADRLDAPDEDEAEPEPDPAPEAEEEPESDGEDFPGAWLAREAYPGPLWQRIPEALTEAGRPLSKDELYEALNQRKGVGAKLAHMVKGGEVTLDDEGRYTLVEDEEPEDDPEPEEGPETESHPEEELEEPDEQAEPKEADPNPDPRTVEVEDFGDTAPVHTKDEPAAVPEHLRADADRLVALCSLEPRSIPKLAEHTGIDRKDAKRLVDLLVKERRLEAHGSETEGVASRAKYRVPPTLEEQGVTVRRVDRTEPLEDRILAALANAVLPLTTKRLSTLLVEHRDEVFEALQPLLERDAVVAGATGWSLPGKQPEDTNGNGKSTNCQVPDCVSVAEPGSRLCQAHGDAVARL